MGQIIINHNHVKFANSNAGNRWLVNKFTNNWYNL